MQSVAVTIWASESEQEILIGSLCDVGAEGFQQTDDTLLAYFFEDTYSDEYVSAILKDYFISKEVIPDQNWNAVWESNFEPVKVGDFCSIRAEFHPFSAQTQFDLVITPKMSFGTGHHATTYMMIEQMAMIDFLDKKVLDFGTGSGVLAVLAEKMGASEIIAIDIDPWSIENSLENIERNGCAKITVEQRQAPHGEAFDIVLANVNRNVILAQIGALKNSLKNGGMLLLSGLLEGDESDIVTASIENGMEYIKQKSIGGWISLLFVKENHN